MKFEQVRDQIVGIPFTTPENGKVIYDFVRNAGPRKILELGFAHGVGACYMAAALDELGQGEITCVDRHSAKDRAPNIDQLLAKTDLSRFARPVYCEHSYTWTLLEMIEENTRNGVCTPIYDFVFIDGAHLFEPDALAFYLSDKLLKPGGWLLFDDLYWTLHSSEFQSEPWVKNLSRQERESPHIDKVFNVLVRQHPNYTDFRIVDQWGWCRKKGGDGAGAELLDLAGASESPKVWLKRKLRPYYRRLFHKAALSDAQQEFERKAQRGIDGDDKAE